MASNDTYPRCNNNNVHAGTRAESGHGHTLRVGAPATAAENGPQGGRHVGHLGRRSFSTVFSGTVRNPFEGVFMFLLEYLGRRCFLTVFPGTVRNPFEGICIFLLEYLGRRSFPTVFPGTYGAKPFRRPFFFFLYQGSILLFSCFLDVLLLCCCVDKSELPCWKSIVCIVFWILPSNSVFAAMWRVALPIE